MKAALDASVLTELLAPDAAPDTKESPYRKQVRALGDLLARQRATIIIPTPVIAEVLVATGEEGAHRLNALQKTRVIQVASFDKRAALETAWMLRSAFATGDKRVGHDKDESWQKIKFDWQIIAISKVNLADIIYTNDEKFYKFSKKIHMNCIYMKNFNPSDLHSDTPLFQPLHPK